MELSQKGLDIIKNHEGWRASAYKVAGANERYWTIGYGHYGADVKPGSTITKAEGEALLKKDVARFVDAVNRLVKVDLTQNQFDALVSFTYNLGEGALQRSTLLTKLNAGDYEGASAEFGLWVNAGGKRMDGLVKRRAQERALFDSGTTQESKPAASKPAASSSSSKASSHKIKSGETLSGIAAKYDTSVTKLMQLNPSIKKADEIQAGQTIRVSGSASNSSSAKTSTYKIKSGDTLSGIAAKFNTSVSALKKLNGIANENHIQAGKTIKVSGTVSSSPKKSTTKTITVKSGDTVSALAAKHGSTQAQIKSWNKLDSKYTIYAGQKLRVK